MPPAPFPHRWSGTCRFDAPGTYSFHCQAHPDQMHGSVIVTGLPDPSVTPSPTPTPTASTSPGATPGGGAPAAQPTPTSAPVAATPGPAATGLKLAASQRGRTLKGSISVARAGSTLTVDVLAKPSALGASGRALKRIGHLTKSLDAGAHTFAIKLSRAASSAITARRRLALTAKVTVAPPIGAPFTANRAVTMRP
jgi:hypothetical protein